MADDKKHYCIKTADGKNETVGINLITSKKGTNKEKRQIKNKLRKEINSNKTTLKKDSLLMNNTIIANQKTNKYIVVSDLRKTNHTLDTKNHNELVEFVFKRNPEKSRNRNQARKIKGRK